MAPSAVVSVFGGSAARPGDPAYQEAETLGAALAREGFAVASGGYQGTMEAASKGAAEAGGRVIGYTCDQLERWHGGRPNRWVQEEVRSPTLHERVVRLISAGQALIALPGGVGTLSEVALAWSLLQTAEISARPLVLVGQAWRLTLDAFLASADGYVGQGDAALLSFASGAEAAARLVGDRLRRPTTPPR